MSKSNRRPENYVNGPGYEGAPLFFEGGVRGAGVSETETLPSQQVFPPKIGYDEHRSRTGRGMPEANVHGIANVEGIEFGVGNGAPSADGGSNGYSCPHGCGAMRSKHGFARHVRAKHGFGALGRAVFDRVKKPG